MWHLSFDLHCQLSLVSFSEEPMDSHGGDAVASDFMLRSASDVSQPELTPLQVESEEKVETEIQGKEEMDKDVAEEKVESRSLQTHAKEETPESSEPSNSAKNVHASPKPGNQHFFGNQNIYRHCPIIFSFYYCCFTICFFLPRLKSLGCSFVSFLVSTIKGTVICKSKYSI